MKGAQQEGRERPCGGEKKEGPKRLGDGTGESGVRRKHQKARGGKDRAGDEDGTPAVKRKRKGEQEMKRKSRKGEKQKGSSESRSVARLRSSKGAKGRRAGRLESW